MIHKYKNGKVFFKKSPSVSGNVPLYIRVHEKISDNAYSVEYDCFYDSYTITINMTDSYIKKNFIAV